jgi:hypothetical protein
MRALRWCLILFAMGTGIAGAHVASNGFVDVSVSGSRVSGSLEFAVRDAELAVGVDGNHDGRVTWGELRAAEADLHGYIVQHMDLVSSGARCALQFDHIQVTQHVDSYYAWIPFNARCASEIAKLSIRYSMLAGIDPSHRGLLRFEDAGHVQTAVLGADDAPVELTAQPSSPWTTAAQYMQLGVGHIWSGIDHLLFLLSLLLPSVLVRRDRHWQPAQRLRPVFIDVLKVVTAFTIAHSITLTLAALNVVHLPSRLTESVIAASIIVAALNNIFPLVTQGRARIAFTFGLLHGFGFASVLADLGLPSGARVLSLVSFNLGIELGQLAVVLAVMPFIYALRNAALYRRALLPWGSAAIAALALVWFVERAFLPT